MQKDTLGRVEAECVARSNSRWSNRVQHTTHAMCLSRHVACMKLPLNLPHTFHARRLLLQGLRKLYSTAVQGMAAKVGGM